jgi:hypothetical protein
MHNWQATVDNDYSGAIATPSKRIIIQRHNSKPLYAVLVNPATSSSCPTIIPVPAYRIYLLPEPTPEGGTICLDPETGELVKRLIH